MLLKLVHSIARLESMSLGSRGKMVRTKSFFDKPS